MHTSYQEWTIGPRKINLDRGSKMTTEGLLSAMGDNVQRLFKRILERNKSRIVTVDDLIEFADFDKQNEIVNSIQELRGAGLLETKTATNHSRFETELIPVGGKTWGKGKPQSIKATVISRPKRK